VRLKAGPFVFPFPNTKARVHAVKLHDLHHVLTDYETTWTGEAEIAAWEIASGCGPYYAAWLLNFGALAIGLLIAPRKTCRAFL
jgi:ubiquinone biosynthesis protein Coq4